MYFDQLLGAARTRKLVKLLFFSRFQVKTQEQPDDYLLLHQSTETYLTIRESRIRQDRGPARSFHNICATRFQKDRFGLHKLSDLKSHIFHGESSQNIKKIGLAKVTVWRCFCIVFKIFLCLNFGSCKVNWHRYDFHRENII